MKCDICGQENAKFWRREIGSRIEFVKCEKCADKTGASGYEKVH